MLNKAELQQMSSVELDSVDISTLVNIQDVEINPNLPIDQRMKKYVEQIKNPYVFMSGDVPVKITFSNPEKTLDKAIINYFKTLKTTL